MRRQGEEACVLLVLIHAFICFVHGDMMPSLPDFTQEKANLDDAPPSESKQVIESFHVQTDIRYRFATTKMTSLVRNTAGIAHEMVFGVTLPKQAFIVSFVMTIDGKSYDGQVKEKMAAKQQYQRAVDEDQSAGHLRQTPRHSNRFDMSVNVANGTAVNFTLVYQQTLSRKFGVYEYEMHVEPGQAVEDFSLEVFIQENRPLTFVRTPKLRTDSLQNNKIEALNDLTSIVRPTVTSARIQYKPTVEQQGGGGLAARFVVQYGVKYSDQGDVLLEDGYFIHLFSPKSARPLPKDIIFVMDTSGSMDGTKIAQMKDAMVEILGDLMEQDRFNILYFSDSTTLWENVLTGVTNQTVLEAKQFIETKTADGGTDINNALLTGLRSLRGREVKKRVGMIFFLTDGEATSGETSTAAIARNVRLANVDNTCIYSLAFGSGADFKTLKAISTQNCGFARKIYEAWDAASQVETLYVEISSVAMKGITVKYLPSVTKTTQTIFPVVQSGSEIVIAGWIDRKHMNKEDSIFTAEIEGTDVTGDIDIVLEVDDIDSITIKPDESLNSLLTTPRDYSGIMEKMWAFMSIKQMLNEKEALIDENEELKALNEKILDLSLKYNLVTPLTSMVVTKPDQDSPVESGLQDADDLGTLPVMPLSRRTFTSSGHRYTPIARYGGMLRSSRHRNMGVMNAYSHAFRPNIPGNRTPMAMTPPPISQLKGAMPMPTKHSSSSQFGVSDPRPAKVHNNKKPKVPVNKLSGGRNNRRRKTKKATIGILKSIVFSRVNNSLCLAPRRVPVGKYLLASSDNFDNSTKDFVVELDTGCLKKCRFVIPETLHLVGGQRATSINLKSLDKWLYSGHPDFDVAFEKTNKVSFIHENITVSISKTQKRKKMFFSIELHLSPLAEPSSSSLASLLGGKRRKPRNLPRACASEKADVSLYLKKKNALKYKI